MQSAGATPDVYSGVHMSNTDDRSVPHGRRLGVREVRAALADVIGWAAAGERITVTVRGRPAAMIVSPTEEPVAGLDLLVASGQIVPPRRPDRPPTPEPATVPADVRVERVIDQMRGRR